MKDEPRNPDNVGGLPEKPSILSATANALRCQSDVQNSPYRPHYVGAVSTNFDKVADVIEDAARALSAELCRAAPAGGECQHEWAEDGDATAGRLFCRLCKIDKPASAPAGSGEVVTDEMVASAVAAFAAGGGFEATEWDAVAWSAKMRDAITAALLHKLQQEKQGGQN